MKSIVILGCENSHADRVLKFLAQDPALADIKVIGVYSEEREAADKLRDTYGVPVMEDYAEAVGKVDGVVIVSSPQDLVSMIVAKAANMANMMNVPVLGLVENMSYVKCPDCGKEIAVFGESHIGEVAAEFGYPVLARVPLDPSIAALVDDGRVEAVENNPLADAADMIAKALQ